MRKIPTVFKRNPENMRGVLPEVTPGCEWVLAGEGVPTRKYDGTCCMFDGLMWWARREVKPGQQVPNDFRPEMTDETTGKTVGWVPMVQSAFKRWHEDALTFRKISEPGTYELCGPKINGNPEDYGAHTLIHHDALPPIDAPRDFDGLREFLHEHDFEGIVWHHPDGRMAKLKARDF